MPVFKYYSENGKLLSSKDETLNSSNVERYLEENSKDVAIGYTDALADFIRELDNIIHVYRPTSIGQRTDAQMRKGLLTFFEERKIFLESLQKADGFARPESTLKSE